MTTQTQGLLDCKTTLSQHSAHNFQLDNNNKGLKMYRLTKILKPAANVLKTSLEILISLILTCVLGPIFLVVWTANELARIFVTLLLRLKFQGKFSLVQDGADNVWMYKKTGNNRMCVIAMFSNDAITNLEEERDKCLRRVILKEKGWKNSIRPYEKLTKTFTRKFGYDCFRRDEFDIKKHVKFYKPSKDTIYTEEEFLEHILPELAEDMDESKPQWELIIIRGVKCSDSEIIQSVRCFRYHHGYMDGASANLMFAHCMFDDPPETFPYIVDVMAELRVPQMKIFLIKLLCLLCAALTMVKVIYKAARLKGRYVAKVYSGKRHFGWSEKLDASILRKVKTNTKVSAPTILATATGAALYKLQKLKSQTEDFDKEVVLGMVNVLIPYEDINPKNQFTLTHFTLPTGDMHWLKRVRKVNEQVVGIPYDPSFFLTRFMFSCFGRFPSAIVQRLMEDAGNPISFSNVPMTFKEVRLWGTQVNAVGGWAPLVTNTGLGIIIMRYANHIRFLSVSDEACVSKEEMQYFLRQVNNEINLMADDCTNSNNNSLIVDTDKVLLKV